MTVNLRDGIAAALTLLRGMSKAQREEYVSAVSFSRVKWTSDGGPTEQYLEAYADAVALKRDTRVRLQLASMLPGVPCRQTTHTALDWSPNIMQWDHEPSCSDLSRKPYTIADVMQPYGAAGFHVGPLPNVDVAAANVSVRQHLRARYGRLGPALDANADSIVQDLQVAAESQMQGVSADGQAAAQDVLLVTTSDSMNSGGASQTLTPSSDLWRRYHEQQAADGVQAQQRAREHLLNILGDAGSDRVRAAIVQHYAHVLLARGEGSEMLLAVSAWSAPLTPVFDLTGSGGYTLRVDIAYSDGTRGPPLRARFPPGPLFMWSSRRIIVPLWRPAATVKVSLLLDGSLGTVAFDEPDVRVYKGV